MRTTFSDAKVQEVWAKGLLVPGVAPDEWRKDACGAWITRDQYGNHDSLYGWDIDHIKPVSEGGGDELWNLRPLQWENNASRQADRLDCVVFAEGNKNVRKPGR